jgi:transposase
MRNIASSIHIARSAVAVGPFEGFNSRSQSNQSAARGFRIFPHYRIRILFFVENSA